MIPSPARPKPEGPLRGCVSYKTACLSRRTAEASDIDELGHVNNAIYVSWIQDAAVGHWFAAAPPELSEAHVWVCSRHEIDYKGQIVEGDAVEVRTWLGDVRGARFVRYTDIRKRGDAKPASLAKTWWVLLDKRSGKPRRVDAAMLALFGVDGTGASDLAPAGLGA